MMKRLDRQSPETGERRDPRKFYRFALYGRSGSGKTCVLARMALGALGHPEGLDCARLPVTLPKPTGPPETYGPQEREAAELHAGKEWIDEAVARLRDGETPHGNLVIDEDRFRQTVDFKITDPHGCRATTFVRMIDYSGESIHPDTESDPKSSANQLKAKLRTLDGLIVIADASTAGSRGETLAHDHRLLREALASLAQDQDAERMPVVVAFTKWDRESLIQTDDHKAECDKLDKFLNAHPAHKALVDSIHNVAKVEETSDGPGRVAFPTSAFGEAVQRDGRDIPALGESPPHPFGLLEPLLALAELRDAIDAEKAEAEVASWRPWRLWKLSTRAGRLLKRIPSASRAAGRVKQVGRSAWRWSAAISLVFIALILLCSLLGIGYEINSRRFALLGASIANPAIDETGLVDARERLQSHGPGGWTRWLPLAPNVADVRAVGERIDERLDEILWRPIDATVDPCGKADQAETYIKRLPNGKHAGEVNGLVNACETVRAEQRAESELADWEKRIRESDGDRNSILEIRKEISVWSYAGNDDSKRARRDALAARCVDQVAAKDWLDIQGLLDFGEVGRAAHEWARLASADEGWKARVPELIRNIKEVSSRNAEALLDRENFDDAQQRLRAACDALKALEQPVRTHAPEFVEPLMAALSDMGPEGPLNTRVIRAKDRAQYEGVRASPSKDSAQRYIDGNPMGAMLNDVKAYLHYLTEREKVKEIEIGTSILWGADYPDGASGHVFVLLVDGEVKLRVNDLKSSKGNKSSPFDNVRIKISKDGFLSDKRAFQAKIYTWSSMDLWNRFSYYLVCEGASTLHIHDLEGDGKRVMLVPPNGDNHRNQAILKIVSGVPQRPELPPWKSPQSSR